MSDAISGEASGYDHGSDVPAFPVLVKVAGIMWIVYGCLMVLNQVVWQAAGPAAPGARREAVASSAGCLGIVFAIAFFLAGARSLRGTARDTLGNSIGSFVIGALNVGVGGLFLAWGGVGAVLPFVAGVCLIVAGILALTVAPITKDGARLIARGFERKARARRPPDAARLGRPCPYDAESRMSV